jgi:hypothetical protein
VFRQGDWSRFYENVAALPLNSSSTFIRTVTANQFNGVTTMGFASFSGSMRQTIDSFRQGQITSYFDIVEMYSR